MGIPLKTIINEAIGALMKANYQESTIKEYCKTFSNLMELAEKQHDDCYSWEMGELFRSDTINERTGKYSLYRWKRRNRCVEMFNWYEKYGYFNLSAYTKSRIETPRTLAFQELQSKYLSFLTAGGLKQNTVDSFRNISCKFLRFLEDKDYSSIDLIPSDTVFSFIAEIRKTWSEESLRTAVSALRSFFRFAENAELCLAADSIKTVKAQKIIPVLTSEEEDKLWDTLNSDSRIIKRDKAIVLLGLMTGLRACDIVNLKTTDIDWHTGSITIIQQKTGNLLTIPLFPVIGNAIADYILQERPKIGKGYLFMRRLAPYRPLSGHSSCYLIIKKVFALGGIQMNTGICGTRLLRHNAASKLLISGVSVEIIASILGHVDPDSTSIYLTTDAARLRECGLPLSAVPVRKGVLQ